MKATCDHGGSLCEGAFDNIGSMITTFRENLEESIVICNVEESNETKVATKEIIRKMRDINFFF